MIDILTYNDIVKNVCVYGLDESVKASKYPMAVDTNQCTDEITDRVRSLAACEKGSGHDQFLTGMIVQFDLTLSIKAWTEAERYHFLDFVSSQSTMHRIASLDIDEQCNEYVTENTKKELFALQQAKFLKAKRKLRKNMELHLRQFLMHAQEK